MKKPFIVKYWNDDKEKQIKIGCSSYEEALIRAAKINKRSSYSACVEVNI